jgi:hypothetical protein
MAVFVSGLTGNSIVEQANKMDTRLRGKLESIYLAALKNIEGLATGELERLETGLSKLFQESGLRNKPAAIKGLALAISPVLTALSEPAALALFDNLEETAKKAAQAENPADYISSAITDNFLPIIEKLTDDAERMLHDQMEDFVQALKALTFGPVDATINQISTWIERADSPPDISEGESLAGDLQSMHEKITRLRLLLAETLVVSAPE